MTSGNTWNEVLDGVINYYFDVSFSSSSGVTG
jgi:hypothetical protein